VISALGIDSGRMTANQKLFRAGPVQGDDQNAKSKCFVCDLFGCPADIHDENAGEWIIGNRDSQEFELNHQGKMKDANPANKLLTES
jgi:hypothetical protein